MSPMDFKLGRINLNAVAQGVGGLVFGSEDSTNEDSYVEQLLDRISNSVRSEDKRSAITELQSLVSESRSAQLAFGVMGFPVLLSVLKDGRDDAEMVRGSLETLVSALTPIDTVQEMKNEVKPASLNADLLSRESDSISLLLDLLSEDDFYVRYYTLQLLTTLLTHAHNRLQEAILTIPRGITRLMDMLMDREVIRNEALLLLTYLTREAEEIQKIVVFEGAFEKLFSIIKEEGGSEGGVVVQDCLDLLNNLIRKNTSNQVLLRETVGFEPLLSMLKLRRGSAFNFTQQKTINLLKGLETVKLLLDGGPDGEPGKEVNRIANQNVLTQKKILEHLLLLGVESQWAPVSVRCLALQCIGDLVLRNHHSLQALANKKVGEERHIEPALNAILRVLLRTSTVQEFVASDYVFKCCYEESMDGQTVLASTMFPHPGSNEPLKVDDDNSMSFGSMLLHSLLSSGINGGDLEPCCRAASVLSHVLKDNLVCKERVLLVKLDVPVPSLGSPEPLLHRIVKYLALSTSKKNKSYEQNKAGPTDDSYVQLILLRLLITWLADCSNAVHCFIGSPSHITYLLELVLSPQAGPFVRGLAAVLLGECVLYNKSHESSRDAFNVVDAISQKLGLTSFFLNFDMLNKSIASISPASAQPSKPLERSFAASTTEIEEVENDETSPRLDHPVISAIFDASFVTYIQKLERDIRESILEAFSRTKNGVAVVPAELEQKKGEVDGDYIKRLKSFVEKQCVEMEDLLGRNSVLAEDLSRTGVGEPSDSVMKQSNGRERIQNENLRQDLQEAAQHVKALRTEKAKLEAEVAHYRNLAAKCESDLKSLSDAYNSLEKDNLHLESEVKMLKKGGNAKYPDLELVKAAAREEAQRESEAELNDLFVCLGQEQSKVEKLTNRLEELGEDVDALLDGIGEGIGLPEDEDEEDHDEK